MVLFGEETPYVTVKFCDTAEVPLYEKKGNVCSSSINTKQLKSLECNCHRLKIDSLFDTLKTIRITTKMLVKLTCTLVIRIVVLHILMVTWGHLCV